MHSSHSDSANGSAERCTFQPFRFPDDNHLLPRTYIYNYTGHVRFIFISYIAITHDVHHPYRLFINVWIRCKSDDLIIFQWYYQYHPTILIVTFKLKTLEVSVTKCMHDNNETHSLIAISISLIVSPLSLELFASCDVAVSLLPATMHIPLAEQAISQGYETRLLLESVSSPLTP